MKSWQDYGNHFLDEILDFRISILEVTLMVALVLMCLVSAIETSLGRDVGDRKAIDMAQQQAQQDLMALRTADAQ